MLYEMAVGRVPFRGRTPIAVMTAHLTEDPEPPRSAAPNRGMSPALEAVITRAMMKDRADRYENARAFAEALAAARDQPLVIALRPVADAQHLATVDTDLHLSTSAIAQRATVPSDDALAKTEEHTVDESLRASLERASKSGANGPEQAEPESSGRVLWTVVAIVALAVGVLLGVLIGSK
jgi:serine/threonine-protein kinase